MLAYFSFVDILKIPEINAIAKTPFDLLPRSMDSVVAPYLFKLGMDIDKGIRVQCCVHRTIDLQRVISYRYVGLERSDKEWLANRNCSMSARIHSQTDNELASDMVRMSMEGTSEGKFIAMCASVAGADGTTRSVKETFSETWEEDYIIMQALRDIQKQVRGYLHADEDVIADGNSFGNTTD